MYLDNKYTRTYFSLITKAKSRNFKSRKEAKTTLGYVERHHIIPKSIGGTDSKSNLVYLTAREHFICHWLLIKMTDEEDKNKMIYALFMMKSKTKNHKRRHSSIHSRVFEIYKSQHSEMLSNMNNDRVKNGTHNWLGEGSGIHSRVSEGSHSRMLAEENKKRVEMGIHNFQNDQNNQNLLDAGIHASQIKVCCVHCKSEVDKANFGRYHGDNCDYLKEKYTFQNNITGEIKTASLSEFVNTYPDVIRSKIRLMIRGEVKAHRGWALLE